MSGELAWRKAINKALESSPTPLHYNEITEQIISDGLRTNVGATPAATVNDAQIQKEPVIFLVIKLFFCYCSIIMKLQDNKNDDRTLRGRSSACGLPQGVIQKMNFIRNRLSSVIGNA